MLTAVEVNLAAVAVVVAVARMMLKAPLVTMVMTRMNCSKQRMIEKEVDDAL